MTQSIWISFMNLYVSFIHLPFCFCCSLIGQMGPGRLNEGTAEINGFTDQTFT